MRTFNEIIDLDDFLTTFAVSKIKKESKSKISYQTLIDLERLIWGYGEENPEKVHGYLSGILYDQEYSLSLYKYSILGEAFVYLAKTNRLNDYELRLMVKKLMDGGGF